MSKRRYSEHKMAGFLLGIGKQIGCGVGNLSTRPWQIYSHPYLVHFIRPKTPLRHCFSIKSMTTL